MMTPRPPARLNDVRPLPAYLADPRPIAIVAIPDLSTRERVSSFLTGLRWRVTQAGGGAEALMHLEQCACSALLLDSWLPDLEMQEFLAECRVRHPEVDVVSLDIACDAGGKRSPRRHELLLALRSAMDEQPEAAGAPAESCVPSGRLAATPIVARVEEKLREVLRDSPAERNETAVRASAPSTRKTLVAEPLAELVGESKQMQELCRLVRLVAPRKTTVLIEGPTGTGKELVARAVHRLSPRSHKPMMVLNCAAIPEALLEAELFGHTRGAFTGAVNARVGRIEAANGGTLFLDEIGEMPLMLQSKLLRFVESGELQRVGDNETVRVDVRVIAATHQPLRDRAANGTFRADLYYRLAVFPVSTPPLAARGQDIARLAQFFLRRHGTEGPVKGLHVDALAALQQYGWPGNVRELEHVIERAYILAEDRPLISVEDLGIPAQDGIGANGADS